MKLDKKNSVTKKQNFFSLFENFPPESEDFEI